MRILLVGGGSIGHVAPAVAVWRALERRDPDGARHLVCSEEPGDAAFLTREQIPFTSIRGRRFSPLRPDVFVASLLAARRLIKEFRPDAIFSKGGALSVPVCLAARIAGVPIVLHESDAVSGKANRLVGKWAKTVCTGFPSAGPSIFTGNPVRPEVTTGKREDGLRITGFSGTRPVLLVMGGSQGAASINGIVAAHLPELIAIADVIHLTGKGKPGGAPQTGYWSAEFAYEDLPHLYALATLALSRSGAGGISELAACGIPALLVPLRGLAQDHQLANALAAEKSGGCVALDQETLDERLIPAVRSLLEDSAQLTRMREAIRALSRADAADRIAESVLAAADLR